MREITGERATLHKPTPVPGVRLRDASVVVGNGVLDVTPAIEGMPAGNAADTITDLTPTGPITDAPGIAMIALRSEPTVPRLATGAPAKCPDSR